MVQDGDKMERCILHIDVNNAFLSWTALDRLKNGDTVDIRTIPAIIGGDEASRHGVVLAKSMPAKQFGIKTGEPIYFARKKCPQVRTYKGSFTVYRYYSNLLYNLFLEYTDQIERFSIDECFLDVTMLCKNRENTIKIANEIRNKVKKELGFTVNVGVSSNKLLAKMASDFEKPDKIHTLYKEEIQSKMWNLPISDLFLEGKRTLPKLEMLRIKTIGDLAKQDSSLLIKKFGKYGYKIWQYANGIDNSKVDSSVQKPKGIGHSITLSEDIKDIERLNKILLDLTEQVCYRLRKNKMKAQVVNMKIRTKNFENYSHQKKIDIATNSTKIIYKIAKELLKELHKNREVRLIGIRADKLAEDTETQISLFKNEKEEKLEKLDKVVDNLKEKYGNKKITRGML